MTTRWAIPRTLLLAPTLLVGLAYAGSGWFGRRSTPEPEPEPAAPEEAQPVEPATPAAPPPPPPPPLFPSALPIEMGDTPAGLANSTAQGCNGCHYAAHDAWHGSAHATAWEDESFTKVTKEIGDSTMCTGCHLPLTVQHRKLAVGYFDGDITRPDMRPNPAWDASLMREGVTCAACHIRDGKVLGTRDLTTAPHPVVASPELTDSSACAACHQLSWPEADLPVYNTYGEWKDSAYAEAGVRCQDCHMPPKAGPATATTFAAQPDHAFEARLDRALSVLFELPNPQVERGVPFQVGVRIQNTGAGHSVPTGSPFKKYQVEVTLLDDAGKPLVEPYTHELARVVEKVPPYNTLSDSRLASGSEVKLETSFEVSQRKKSTQAVLSVSVRSISDEITGPILLQRTIPLPLL